jgi:molybdate transport system substrate-binding protein
MTMKKWLRSGIGLLLVSLLLLSAFGCGGTADNNQQPEPDAKEPVSLTIAAAASLTDAMDEIKELYAKEKPEVTLTMQYAGSGALQQQIEQGAPVDVFMSAATKNMDPLEEKGLLLDGSRKDLLLNKVVLVVPEGSTGIAGFEDLKAPEVQKIAIGDPESVPAGQYAKEALTNLGIFDQVESKLVLGQDVRQVLTYVETGDVDAGIVYMTDTKVSTKVKVVAEAPETSHSKVVYPSAVMKDSQNIEAAKEFAQFLSSDQANAVFERYGFTIIGQ